jgi:hypothetical protein
MAAEMEKQGAVKGGFLVVDSETGALQSLVAMDMNPQTLTRTLEPVSPVTPGPTVDASPIEPREVIAFSFRVEGAEGSGAGATGLGIYPQISALELLMYTAGGRSNPLILFAWGSHRLEPVRIDLMEITEQAFDASLSPVRAEVRVMLTVLKDADVADTDIPRRHWDNQLAEKRRVAALAPAASLAELGLSGI